MRVFFGLFILLYLCPILSAQDKMPDLLPIGAMAPDFLLKGTDDKTYSLADFSSNKILVVIFTCNHCPTAQAYEERIIKAVEDYRPKGVGFVAISPNSPTALSLAELGYSDLGDELEDMKKRADEKKFNFPYLYDGNTQETSIKYGPSATPHVFIFDGERKLRYSGRIDNDENPYKPAKEQDMRNALDALLQGKEVPVPVTKTFGCSVKWAWKNEWTEKLKADWSKEPVLLGELGPDSLRTLLANTDGKLRLINFWASWCAPCVIEFPEFVTINRMYRNREFEFISVSTDKPPRRETALTLLGKWECSAQNYIWTGKDSYELIELTGNGWQGAIPLTLLIAPGGQVIYKSEGPIDPWILKKTIVNHLGRYYADDNQ